MNLTRVWAIMVRYLYLYKRSLPRVMEIFYFPTLDLLIWGFITLFLSQSQFGGIADGVVNVFAFFLGALILWDVLSRSTLGVSLGLLEELWSRNVLNLFVSPLNANEFLLGILSISGLKMIFAAAIAAVLALVLYSFNIFTLGFAILPFAVSLLVSGWIFGIFAAAIILRYGIGAEVLAWGVTFTVQPLSAVFWPVSVYPDWLKPVALANPATHVFEGMRAIIQTGHLPIDSLAWAFGLNAVYLVLIVWFFLHVFKIARQRGLLVKLE